MPGRVWRYVRCRCTKYDDLARQLRLQDQRGGVLGWRGQPRVEKLDVLHFQPAFFGNCNWPAFGSDLNPMTRTLPAKARYDGNPVCDSSLSAPTNLRIIRQ